MKVIILHIWFLWSTNRCGVDKWPTTLAQILVGSIFFCEKKKDAGDDVGNDEDVDDLAYRLS